MLFQVMGAVRCPLYTLPGGLGFPAFLQHQYIGTCRSQLVQGIEQRELLTAQEIQAAAEVRTLITDHHSTIHVVYSIWLLVWAVWLIEGTELKDVYVNALRKIHTSKNCIVSVLLQICMNLLISHFVAICMLHCTESSENWIIVKVLHIFVLNLIVVLNFEN